ncbi:MAG: HNH endonuclease [Gemmatimonadetes bacterium]|nr:HNH endonuclease [Gemmatimonadota bacterium]
MRETDPRLRIFRRDGFRCVYCGAVCEPDLLTLDHVEPRIKGGDRSGGNLVTCCRVCNQEKGGEPAWAWLSRQPDRRANFLMYATAVWPRLRRAVEQAARSTRAASDPKL